MREWMKGSNNAMITYMYRVMSSHRLMFLCRVDHVLRTGDFSDREIQEVGRFHGVRGLPAAWRSPSEACLVDVRVPWDILASVRRVGYIHQLLGFIFSRSTRVRHVVYTHCLFHSALVSQSVTLLIFFQDELVHLLFLRVFLRVKSFHIDWLLRGVCAWFLQFFFQDELVQLLFLRVFLRVKWFQTDWVLRRVCGICCFSFKMN